MKARALAPGRFVARRAVELFGTSLDNPLGLAAGFDKNAELIDAAREFGFGYVEVGSVTRHGGPGNPRPRMFRLAGGDLLNRMGLNGDPVDEVVERMKTATSSAFAVNVAKTHDPTIMGDEAIADMVYTHSAVKMFGIYTALNISCPNTAEGRTFEDPGPLDDLLSAIDVSGGARPVLVKLSPVLAYDENRAKLEKVIEVCESYDVAGYIAANTVPTELPKVGKGGRSGSACLPHALNLVHYLTARTSKPVIGVGGIRTAADAHEFCAAGAVALQAYCGFVRGPHAGARFAHHVNRGLEAHRS